MRTRIVLVAIATLLSLTTAANAVTMTGTVRSYDHEKRRLVLDNGYQYSLPPRIEDSAIRTGETVTINWDRIQNGVRVARTLQIMSEPEATDQVLGDD